MPISKFDFLVCEVRGKIKGLANRATLLVFENTNDSNRLFDEIMLLIDDYNLMLDEAIASHDCVMLSDIRTKVLMNYKEIKEMLEK